MIKFINALFEIVGLQLFADAGTNVNTSTGFVNAYSGDERENTMPIELKAFYDTELLENARIKQVYAQFGKRQHLPRNHRGTVEWRKWNTFQNAEVLQEGVIPTGQDFGMTNLQGSIAQFGTYTTISDILELRAFDDVILGATEEMGASAGETQEKLIRDALLSNLNILYCDNYAADGTVVSTPTAPDEMEDSAEARSLLTPSMVNKAVTIMKRNRVPLINGKYFAVIHPDVAHDLRESDGWLEIHKYAATTELFNGEIGELHGVRFIENVFAPILDGDYANKAGGVTYATYFFGKDSFGIIDPEGGALEMIIKDKNQAGGPLNQFSTIGYKFESNGATILYPERLLRAMSCSTLGGMAEAN